MPAPLIASSSVDNVFRRRNADARLNPARSGSSLQRRRSYCGRPLFVWRCLNWIVDLLQAITFVDANSGDSVALKFASENPIPRANLERCCCQPQLAILVNIEIGVVAGSEQPLHLVPRHPKVDAVVERQDLAAIWLTIHKGLDDPKRCSTT
jgi:hypothetical protein